MHGRVKVRTSAELQAINRKKEQEKAAVYELKMRNLMQKKKEGQYDEEMLSLTADILFMNPDVATVWNTRKQYLLELKTKNVADIQTLIDAELKLTEAGLRINPKSYCAWYHRCWILENFASDSHWARELQICTKYLELDDRNFHCWDYRRYVVERHRAKLENELDYSLKKLMSNFSNYSAWHYRSKLIPRVYSTFERENLFENEIYQHEISLVENAVYTDPNDQSAWFYQRWLLGHISSSPRFIQAGYCQNIGKVWVVVYPRLPSVSVRGLGDSKWEFLYENKYSNLLVKNVSSNCKGSITLLNNENKVIDTINFETDSFTAKIPDFKLSLDEKEIISLQQQLKSYEKLLELEPNNKWTLLTVIIIKEKLGEIIEPKLLENLEENDPYRRNYYSDWRSRHQIEAALSSVTHWSGRFEIPNQGLTSFFHSYYFTLFQEVNLSGNPLGNNVIRKLDVLLSCKVLKLADCKLTSIDEFPCLPSLRILDLSANKIQCQNIPCGLLKCKFLESVNFLETNIFQTIITEISEKLPNVNVKL